MFLVEVTGNIQFFPRFNERKNSKMRGNGELYITHAMRYKFHLEKKIFDIDGKL